MKSLKFLEMTSVIDDPWVAYNLSNKYSKEASDLKDEAKDIKRKIDQEVEAIESKLNSVTAYNSANKKNIKVENKITIHDTITQGKLDRNSQAMKDNEERRDNKITIARTTYNLKLQELENRLTQQINTINSDFEHYRTYLQNERAVIETKNTIVIKDLSSNIVTPSFGNTIDRDSNPKLKKLELEAEHKLKEADKKEKEAIEYHALFTNLLEKQNKRLQREANERIREEDSKKRHEERLAQEKKRVDDALKAQQAERQREEKEQQRKDDEEKEKKTVEWRKTVIKSLLRDDEFSNCYQQLSDKIKKQFEDDLSSAEEIKIYVNEIKDDLLLLYNYSDALMDDDNNKQLYYKYDVLSYDEKLQVVKTKSKKKQRELICKYHEEYVEREREE